MMKQSSQCSSLLLAMFLAIGLCLSGTSAEAAGMKVDINTANMAQLEAVNGIGHDTAKNILEYKKEHGPFKTMDDLEGVKGVGKVRLDALNEAFMVEATKKNQKESS